MVRTTQRTHLETCAQVYCEDAGRLGTLSYLVPADMQVRVGDAVRVPFGKSERRGVVVGAGDAALATRPITEVYGQRVNSIEIDLALELAALHGVPFTQIAPRLAPRTRRGNPALDAGDLALLPGATYDDWNYTPSEHPRIVAACAPLVDPYRFAALEAHRMVAQAAQAGNAGQVLVLCPTKTVVTKVLKQFDGGAARLDVVPKVGAMSPWAGMMAGTVSVGVSTRASALWSCQNLVGVVVVDEAHPGFIEAAQPNTNAALVAARRANLRDIACTLVAGVPSPAALGAKVKCVKVGEASMFPDVQVLDRSTSAPSHRAIPPSLHAAVRDSTLPTLVVAPAKAARFRCRVCKQISLDETCAKCAVPGVRTSRDPEAMVASFARRGLDVESCTVGELLAARTKNPVHVVLFDIDSLESFAEMYPGQTAARVLYSACRRAGSGGQVTVMTAELDTAAISHLARRKDLIGLAKWRWEDARQAKLPPFVSMAHIETRRSAAPRRPGVGRVLGPKLRSDGEWEMRILFTDTELAAVHRYVASLRRGGKVRVAFS